MVQADVGSRDVKGLELLGIFLQSFAGACINLKLLIGDDAARLTSAAPDVWYPAELFVDSVRSITSRFADAEPIKERIGMEMMRGWYERGPGRSIVSRGVEFLQFQTGSGGYRSVVRGPEELIGAFELEELDETAGRACVRSSTSFDRTIERGVLIAGLEVAGDLVYVDVDNSVDPSVFRIRFK
jgi:hypothetical protein